MIGRRRIAKGETDGANFKHGKKLVQIDCSGNVGLPVVLKSTTSVICDVTTLYVAAYYFKVDFLYKSKRSDIQSTLDISKSKGPSKTLRDIRTSTYQICSIEGKTI